ncbi:hypothetical protein E3N88_32933 [Mikania micrantha]|uniref:Uncharacterized protein n=1 Tax=Mikania micrantha TaxID=192012 RepID=A0A5N6MAJ8_9ASTR|nr:hypothetical protein E3N88_32933 [Mikania micrantha]
MGHWASPILFAGDSMREMVNVGKNRARNGVTDGPESRNEDKIEKYRPRSSSKCVMKVPAAVGQNMRTAVKGAAYAYDGLNDLNHVMMYVKKSCTGINPMQEQEEVLCKNRPADCVSPVEEILCMYKLSTSS